MSDDRPYLTLVEILTLMAVSELGENAPAPNILQLIAERTNTNYFRTAPRSALRRLVAQKRLEETVTERAPDYIGRAPLAYTITDDGRAVLAATVALIDDMRGGIGRSKLNEKVA